MRKILSLLFVSFLLINSVPARADVDAAGAGGLKKNVEDTLSWYQDLARAAGQGFRISGDVEVSPAGDHYKVRLPGVAMLAGTGYTLDIGDVIMNAAPGAPGEWLLSVAVPKTMTLHDAAGIAVADLSLGSQKLVASWIPAQDIFPRYEAAYGDITLLPRTGAPFSLKVAAASARRNLVRGADGAWTGPAVYMADHMELSVSGERPASLKLEKIAMHGTYEKMTFEGQQAAKAKIRALLSDGKSPLTAEELRQIITAVADKSTDLPDSFTSAVEIDNLAAEVSPPVSAVPQPPPVQILLVHGGSNLAVKGVKQDRGSAAATGSIDTLRVTGVPPPIDGMIPIVASVDVHVDNLPMKELSKAVVAILSASAEKTADPQKSQADVRAALSVLPQMLAGANATLAVKNTYMRARDVSASLDGNLAANAASPMVAVGTMTFSMGGIDELIHKFQSMSSSPAVMSYAQMMLPFDLMGQLQKGSDGKSLRVYKIDFTPEGKILLNGLDLAMAQALMSGGSKTP